MRAACALQVSSSILNASTEEATQLSLGEARAESEDKQTQIDDNSTTTMD